MLCGAFSSIIFSRFLWSSDCRFSSLKRRLWSSTIVSDWFRIVEKTLWSSEHDFLLGPLWYSTHDHLAMFSQRANANSKYKRSLSSSRKHLQTLHWSKTKPQESFDYTLLPDDIRRCQKSVLTILLWDSSCTLLDCKTIHSKSCSKKENN